MQRFHRQVPPASVRPTAGRPTLKRFAQTLEDNPATTIRIAGHTGSTGGDAVDRPLSRALGLDGRRVLHRHPAHQREHAVLHLRGRGASRAHARPRRLARGRPLPHIAAAPV